MQLTLHATKVAILYLEKLEKNYCTSLIFGVSMINKLNSCSLWTHSHWAKTIIFYLDQNMINRFHLYQGILTEISCEFVSPRTVKKHSTNNRVKKESSYLSRLDFEFSYGHGQQLQGKESSKYLPESLLESGAERLISELCMRTGSVRHEIRPISMRYLWSDLSTGYPHNLFV